MKYGTLYGIGVGPGDPELITLKAMKILREVAVVFAAASTKNSYSLAVDIASPHLTEGVPVESLGFPMTRDKEILNGAWQDNAGKVAKTLKEEKDVAFITLGDPMTYSTFGYVMHTIKKSYPDIPVKVIPGITSYQSAAASAGRVLAEGEESFTVVSGALGAENLKEIVDHTDNLVMLKVYRNYKEIIDTLKQMDLIDNSILITRCGLDGEQIVRNLEDYSDSVPPYLSLLLIRKNQTYRFPYTE